MEDVFPGERLARPVRSPLYLDLQVHLAKGEVRQQSSRERQAGFEPRALIPHDAVDHYPTVPRLAVMNSGLLLSLLLNLRCLLGLNPS